VPTKAEADKQYQCSSWELQTIREHLLSFNETSYSGYLHQCWRRACFRSGELRSPCGRKNPPVECGDPHQRNVRRIGAGLTPTPLTDILSTNAVFVASRSASTFSRSYSKADIDSVWEKCWHVHQFLLSIVQPKVILCLGCGADRSSFKYLYDMASGHSNERVKAAKHIKWFNGRLTLAGSTLHVLVIGFHHPSYPGWEKDSQLKQQAFRLISQHI
jgi:hypothetical protein